VPTIQYLVALNLGAILGAAFWGRVSETRVGRRGAATLAALIGVLVIPIYVGPHSPITLLLGALLMGACGMAVFGIVPSYLTERFPTAARSVGPGFAYHAGAALGSVTPAFIGALQDRGIRLAGAMAGCIASRSRDQADPAASQPGENVCSPGIARNRNGRRDAPSPRHIR